MVLPFQLEVVVLVEHGLIIKTQHLLVVMVLKEVVLVVVQVVVPG